MTRTNLHVVSRKVGLGSSKIVKTSQAVSRTIELEFKKNLHDFECKSISWFLYEWHIDLKWVWLLLFLYSKMENKFLGSHKTIAASVFLFFWVKSSMQILFQNMFIVLSSVLCDHEFLSGKLLMSVVFLHCGILFFYFSSLILDSAVLYSEIMNLLLRTTCCKMVHFIKTTAKRFVKNKTFHLHFRENLKILISFVLFWLIHSSPSPL